MNSSKKKPLFKICIFVLALHLFFISLFNQKIETKFTPLKETKIAVRTVTFKEPKPITVKNLKPAALKSKSKKRKVLKKQNKKTVKNKQQAHNKLFKKLEEVASNLKNLPAISSKNSTLEVPISILTLNIDHKTKLNSKEHDYQILLINSLRESLELPEYGEVKVKLIVNQDGSFSDLTILEMHSEKNQSYLKNRLPQLTYPCFNKLFKEEKLKDFTITFRNDK